MKEQTTKMLSEDAFFYRLVRVRAKSVQSFRHKIVVKLPYIPYESQILGQLLDLICLAKINLFEPRLESYNPYDMAN